jgi:hypothetical protein
MKNKGKRRKTAYNKEIAHFITTLSQEITPTTLFQTTQTNGQMDN